MDAQQYYKEHGYPIRVKACAAVNTEQILKLAGVDAFTAPADQLQELVDMEGPPPQSLFLGDEETKVDGKVDTEVNQSGNGHANVETNVHVNGEIDGHVNGHTNGETKGHANGGTNGYTDGETNNLTNGHGKARKLEKRTFVDDESGFRLAFAKADSGRGQLKTTQVCIVPKPCIITLHTLLHRYSNNTPRRPSTFSLSTSSRLRL